MQRQWLIGAIAAGSAVVGALVVVGTSPDTGDALDAPVRAATPAAAVAVAASDGVADEVPTGASPAAAGPSPAPVAEAAPEPLTWEKVLSGGATEAPKPPPRVYEPPIKRPKPPLARPALPSSDKPLPADVVGAEVAFDARKDALSVCAQWYGPELRRGEDHVVTVLTLTPGDDGLGHVTEVAFEAREPERFRHMVPCVQAALSDAVFQALPDGAPRVVKWPIWY
ncbi:MAG: hypothetical protein H6733_09665 [Alphaproteobacteria bacterium]|nr:hypothetical protein [Alphaproteobacteria bacterium]